MNPFLIVLRTLALMRSTSGNPSRSPSLPKACLLEQLSESASFRTHTQCHIQIPTAPTTTTCLMCQLVQTSSKFFFTLLAISLLCMVALVLQPYVNNYIKQQVTHKFDDGFSSLLLQSMLVFVGYKLATSCLDVLSDFCGMIFGVRMYSATSYKLIKMAQRTPHYVDSCFMAVIEDDCQRLQNVPSSSISSVTKIIQFVIFSSLLISRLPNYAVTVGLCYWLFLICTICLAVYSSNLNLKIMEWKQKRIQFQTPTSKNQILAHREKQLKSISHLMVVDGIGLILPWVLNVTFMIVIYGFVGLRKEDRYFVLTVFGLLRSSVSGLGTNMNYFAQAWSSLMRISDFIAQKSGPAPTIQPSLHPRPEQVSRKLPNPRTLQPKIMNLVKIASKTTPCLVPMLILLISLSFTSTLMYSWCAKSILIGQSIFSPFNIAALCLELLAPILLFSFLCWANLRMSRAVYTGLLNRQLAQLQKMSSQELNRLSGDIRLLDRRVYPSAYGAITHITNIVASFMYSIVILNNAFSFVVLVMLICLALWVAYLCQRFITLRKQCYRKQAITKGQLLENLLTHTNPLKKWKNIYTYKFFGLGIQLTFISILYLIMIVISSLIITVVMISSTSVEDSSVLVMLISQLDSQFLVLFIQVMILQTGVAAVVRCFGTVEQNRQEATARSCLIN